MRPIGLEDILGRERYGAEIDGVIDVPTHLPTASFATVEIVDALGPDLVATAVPAEVPA